VLRMVTLCAPHWEWHLVGPVVGWWTFQLSFLFVVALLCRFWYYSSICLVCWHFDSALFCFGTRR
jgi:hypothetical protein